MENKNSKINEMKNKIMELRRTNRLFNKYLEEYQ